MRRHEINGKPVPEEWLVWLQSHTKGQIKLSKFSMSDGRVDCAGKLKLIDVSEFPFPLGRIFGDFTVSSINVQLKSLKNGPTWVQRELMLNDHALTSLEGAPGHVGSYMYLDKNNLTSVEHLPSEIGADLYLHNNPDLRSLSGIHKYVKKLSGSIIVDDSITAGLLGVILIADCWMVKHYRGSNGSHELLAAIKIVNNHVKTGKAGVLAAQQELLDAGLDEYATL